MSTPIATGSMAMSSGHSRPSAGYNVRNNASGRNSAEKEIYQYDAPWPVYAIDWCKVPTDREGFRLAVGSLMEGQTNKLQVVARTDLSVWDEGERYSPYGKQPQPDFIAVAEVDTYYPVTKVLWEPRKTSRHSDILVSSSDVLRLWELSDNPAYTHYDSNIGRRREVKYQQQLVRRSELVNMKQRDFCAPITSFDWSEVDPSLIVTASIDTTCTIWNIETCQAKTQLIAHDRDVYDVAFMHDTADIFASVGADGSVRLFDLRSLEHSTILYEAPAITSNPSSSFASAISDGSRPLLRLQFNRVQPDLLATFHMDSDSVQILDIRFPSTPVSELTRSHQSSVNCFSWSPTHPGLICTGGDDAQVLVWDINDPQSTQQPHRSHQPSIVQSPTLRYVAESEVKSLSWNQSLPMWIGIGFGRTVQALHV